MRQRTLPPGPVIERRPSTITPRRFSKAARIRSTSSCGPFSAATAAAWLIEEVLEVDWLCNLSIALIRATGPPATVNPVRSVRPMRHTTDNNKAFATFIARKTEIDTILARLTALSGEHFNCAPGTVNWGDVGTLGGYLERLREVSDAAFHEGEYAA